MKKFSDEIINNLINEFKRAYQLKMNSKWI